MSMRPSMPVYDTGGGAPYPCPGLAGGAESAQRSPVGAPQEPEWKLPGEPAQDVPRPAMYACDRKMAIALSGPCADQVDTMPHMEVATSRTSVEMLWQSSHPPAWLWSSKRCYWVSPSKNMT